MGKPRIYKRFDRWYCAGLGLVVCGGSPASVWKGWHDWSKRRFACG